MAAFLIQHPASRSGRWGRLHKARRSASTRRWRHIWPTWIPTCESPPAWLAHLAWIGDDGNMLNWWWWSVEGTKDTASPFSVLRSRWTVSDHFRSRFYDKHLWKNHCFFLQIHQVLARVQWVDCLDSNGACLWTLSWSRDPHCNLQILGLNNYSTNPWKVDVDLLFVDRPPLLLDNLAILAVVILIISYNARFREIPFSRSPFYIASLFEKRDMFSRPPRYQSPCEVSELIPHLISMLISPFQISPLVILFSAHVHSIRGPLTVP